MMRSRGDEAYINALWGTIGSIVVLSYRGQSFWWAVSIFLLFYIGFYLIDLEKLGRRLAFWWRGQPYRGPR